MTSAPVISPLVKLTGVVKTFGHKVACDGISLDVRAGEVHGLLGENGAGKSTLMRVLYGLTKADAGTIRIDGREVSINKPSDAIRHGIGIVTQEFSLVGTMTVAENILLAGAGLGRLDLKAARTRVAEAAGRLGVEIDPDATVEDLSVGQRQRVEILKALVHDCRVLILDEPTAVLTEQDSAALFAAVRRLTDQGLGVLLISHKLREVLAIAARVSILRHGRLVDTVDTFETDESGRKKVDAAKLASLMVGVDVSGSHYLAEATGLEVPQAFTPLLPTADVGVEPVLVASGLRLEGAARPLLDIKHLEVGKAEIVAVAGISGNGQTELVDVLCGTRQLDRGSVRLLDCDVTASGPAERMAAGLGRILEDRRASIAPTMTVEQTLVLEDLAHYRRGPFLARAAIRRHAEEIIDQYSIKARPTDPIGFLSGGNMQKVLLARALARAPKVIVASQPTRGLDVGACAFVYEQLREARNHGAGVLMVSEDLYEILALADRIVVLYGGRIVGNLRADEADAQQLGLLMAGSPERVAS